MAKNTIVSISNRPDISQAGDDTSHVFDMFELAGQPKLKFNYTISIKFREPIELDISPTREIPRTTDTFTFAIKQTTRPNITVNYTDVNYYNYRTKVATKVDYGSFNLTFYDDITNAAHDILEVYLKSISPIANIQKNEANSLFSERSGPKNGTFNSENIGDGNDKTSSEKIRAGSGSLGPLPSITGGESGIIENICIRHWFLAKTESRDEEPSYAGSPRIEYVEYQYINPKINTMTLDELDMSQSEGNTVSLSFVYDSVFINSPKSTQGGGISRPAEVETFTVKDLRTAIVNAERILRRLRRVDTLPDVSVSSALGGIVPAISGSLPTIALPKPIVDATGFLGI